MHINDRHSEDKYLRRLGMGGESGTALSPQPRRCPATWPGRTTGRGGGGGGGRRGGGEEGGRRRGILPGGREGRWRGVFLVRGGEEYF